MKNKIFELYKPDSLASFLEFSKTNPKEKFVYVIQQLPPNINILSASDFGYLVICLPNRDQAILSTCLLYTSPSPRDGLLSRMPSSA